MMAYYIVFTRAAKKGLEVIPKKSQERIINAIEELADNPRPSGVKILQGEDGLFRIRVGNYRIIYQIQDQILEVVIIRIGDRKDIYR
jgi:mRNA interferase RelE/StbE